MTCGDQQLLVVSHFGTTEPLLNLRNLLTHQSFRHRQFQHDQSIGDLTQTFRFPFQQLQGNWVARELINSLLISRQLQTQ